MTILFRLRARVFQPVLLLLASAMSSLAGQTFNVMDFGARGDGRTLDTAAVQRAIDAVAGTGGTVLIPRHHVFLVSTLRLASGLDFHLAGTLLISTNQGDYSADGVLLASNATNLKITGSGNLLGRSLAFMTGYDVTNEWWLFKDWRPKMFLLNRCTNLLIRDITFADAPFWGLHLLGCEHVLVDHVTVCNRLDVPNDDGIDPDHCRNVEIRNCRLTCGDDGIVLKSTRQPVDFGPCANIYVHDCVIRTQDAGLKIGTETVGDIRDVVFERCRICSSSRGLCIQLRDEGSVSNVVFRRICFTARYHSDPWWGRGEAISFTVLPRSPDTQLGRLQNVFLTDITGMAENSVRINGCAASHIRNLCMDRVTVRFGRWTKYPGNVYDNRPSKVVTPIEPHAADGFSLRFVDGVNLEHCSARWMDCGVEKAMAGAPAIAAENVSDLRIAGFHSASANHPIVLNRQ